MNCAHNGSRLGQVLYQVCHRLQIVHKVSILPLSHLGSFYLLLRHTFPYRLVMSHATMPKTTTQCCKSLHAVITSRQEKSSMSNAVKSGMNISSVWFNSDYLFRCLAHIVNLATQAVISTHSKSRYNNGNPDDIAAPMQDEIGIIQAICIKVHPISN
jgi:hypothetical protein